jgi:hypothetical protein
MQFRPRLADAVALSTSPALLTVHETDRPTGTSRIANANRTIPGRKTVGWSRSIGAGLTRFESPRG